MMQALALRPRATQQRSVASWPAACIVLIVLAVGNLPTAIPYVFSLVIVTYAAIFWLASKERFDAWLWPAIWPYGLIIVLGLVSGHGADRYLYLKDAWYASAAAVYLCAGYVLYRCQPEAALGLRAFVLGGTLVALYHLSNFIIRPELLRMSTAQLREVLGYGSTAPPLALAILFAYFGRWSTDLRLPGWLALACMLTCLVGVASTFSRQGAIITMIGLLAAAGSFSRRELLRFGILGLIGAMALVALRIGLDADLDAFQSSFLGKLARAPEELVIRDYASRFDIIANWRGYETSRALHAYAVGTPFEWVFGRGFGHSVDLGLFMNMGTGTPGVRERINLAPILHNGYAYLLVKAGPMAIALFLIAAAWLYRIGRREAASTLRAIAAPSRLLQACALVILFITWISMGGLAGGHWVLAAGYLLAAVTRSANPSASAVISAQTTR